MPESKSLYDGLSQRMGDVQSKYLWSNMVRAATGEARLEVEVGDEGAGERKFITARPLSTGRMSSYSWPRLVGEDGLKFVVAPGDN